MAILNITEDSFYEGNRHVDFHDAVKAALRLQEEGADMLDIGGCSTRPNSLPVSVEEEINRTIPLLKVLKKKLSIPISIDTFRYEVASQAVDLGVNFLNDVTGFRDPKMRELAKISGLPICIMHMQEIPKTMQENPSYAKGVVHEIKRWFENRIEELLQEGVKKEQIYLDPGIGFGKTLEHNLQILQDLDKLRELSQPLLLGTSRKTFIQKLTKQSASGALYGTLGINSLLIEKEVDVLRVHDVAAHRDLLTVISALKKVYSNV